MNNNNWMLRIFLLPLLLGSLPLLHWKVVNAEIPPTESLSWTNILQAATKKPPVPPRKGRRPGDYVCIISPNAPDGTRVVWSDRPLFLWRGKVSKIAVRRQGYTAYLWSKTITGTESATYSGKALQPGQTYEWVVNNTMFVPFQVMKAQPRQQIAQELTSLENQLQAKGIDIEGIALAKANYFVQGQLWSDVFQEVYSVPKPSASLLKLRQELVVKLCS
jgi:hypothetical protein